MTDPKLIETVAQAIGRVRVAENSFVDQVDSNFDWMWRNDTGWRERVLQQAVAALAAINASGTHWVAPVKLTTPMGGENQNIQALFDAMRTAYLAKTEGTK